MLALPVVTESKVGDMASFPGPIQIPSKDLAYLAISTSSTSVEVQASDIFQWNFGINLLPEVIPLISNVLDLHPLALRQFYKAYATYMFIDKGASPLTMDLMVSSPILRLVW